MRRQAGRERAEAVARWWLSGGGGMGHAAVGGGVCAQESFNTLKMWIKELRDKGPENIVICVAGNKKDLEAQRRVDTDTAQVSRSAGRQAQREGAQREGGEGAQKSQ